MNPAVKGGCIVARCIVVLSLGSAFHPDSALAAQPPDASYPTKALRVVVPTSPGGGTDIVARMIGQRLAKNVSQPVVIDNRPGASGMIGIEIVSKAAPDGYTITAVNAEQTIMPSLVANLPFELERDFAPVTQTIRQSYILVVHPATPAANLKELIDLARAKPLNYTSTGPRGAAHLAGELLKSMTRTNLTHIAYKGTSPALSDVLGGQVPIMFSSPLPVIQHVRTGRLRALGLTGVKRSPALPGVPTIAEAGLEGFEVYGWHGLLAPARTPRVIVNKLNAEIVRVLNEADIKERIANDVSEPVASSPQEFAIFLGAEIKKWSRIIKEAGLRLE